MNYRQLGRTSIKVSHLSFGASALGGVYGPIDVPKAVRAVDAALDCGINYFDVAPAYGGTLAELMLGKALREVPRSRYYLSTKVGKYTRPGTYGADTLDYSRARIRQSFEESCTRLGVEHIDILHLHDIEYQNRTHTEWALSEGYEAVCELKKEGRTAAVGFGIYPMDLWQGIFTEVDIDAALVHNHYCLHDTRLLSLLPHATEKQIGLINGAPFGSGLLTHEGPASWHPATAEDRECFRAAAAYCASQGTQLPRLAIQFATSHPQINTTLFSSADPDLVVRNIRWSEEPIDNDLLRAVQEILAPVRDKDWRYA